MMTPFERVRVSWGRIDDADKEAIQKILLGDKEEFDALQKRVDELEDSRPGYSHEVARVFQAVKSNIFTMPNLR